MDFNLFSLVLSQLCLITVKGETLTIGLLLNGPDSLLDQSNLKSPVDLALSRIEDLVRRKKYLNFTLNFILKETTNVCSASGLIIAGGQTAELHFHNKVHVFIGPPCTFDMIATADLAAYWNIPALTGASVSGTLENKARYQTLTRSAFRSKAIARFLRQMFLQFGWARCAILTHKEMNYHSSITTPDVIETFKVSAIEMGRFVKEDGNTVEILSSIKSFARVIIVALRGEQVREIMIEAHKMGLTNGDYVFISIEPFRNSYYFGNQEWKQEDEYDNIAKEAYESLLTIRLFEPNTKEYFDFQDELRRREQEIYNRTRRSPTDRNFFANAFYDAVILYSLAVNETLAEGGDIRDGYAMTRKMWNRTFEGISGSVTINANGDRDANYVLWDMTDTENGTFHEIFDYYGTTDVLVASAVNKPVWAGGRTEPPPDAPFCGFQNENPACQEEYSETRSILITVALTFICMIIVSGTVLFFVSRRMALNADLMKMSWMIKWNDLVFEKLKQSTFSHSMSMRELSAGGTEHGRTNETVAYFQGRLVMVSKIQTEKVDMTRDVLLELRNMRQLDHTNVIRFIGASVEQPNIAIVQEHCTKGSLEDILHNDDLKLDWTFKCSLINDIVQGLHYIHASNIEKHGYLTSETCFVDSRFVLKLGFYGLHLFRKYENRDRTDNKELYRLLWASPEAIRSEGTTMATKESDIYSAGIVLTEIVTRMEPYELERNNLSIAEIVRRVKEGENPPYRQAIADGEINPQILALIQKCMDERGENRPNTAAMMATMRKINKNIKGGSNLLDNLLARMEQYANNLEKLVEERTAAFLEEKKKAETLLYEVLPKSVADQLKHGNSVKPEAYESVTIFFSDIVGFTSMSAQSTPMQVVTFLNDLYTCFDEILYNFDVYKVETIGDAYMVVSGLPIRNGDCHAKEIANMSLVLIDASSNFKIKHLPDRKLMLRVGIHTGSCVSGVVGLKMPRYCLFGDTVNTASRMESNGEALKVHVSQSTCDILDTLGGFKTEYRGEIEMKGKGRQTTYWLISSETKPKSMQKTLRKTSRQGKEIPPAKVIDVQEV
ncbi:atrial natriuretic peptide receptor 1-like isoform X3 [Apostichopus japonicus]|uniref:atrial natriuretic peptide receptor 1-like isoform X3 n=1 Tax=Stichopus japonicus TaxID=307972 RepID=UPI003AB525FB